MGRNKINRGGEGRGSWQGVDCVPLLAAGKTSYWTAVHNNWILVLGNTANTANTGQILLDYDHCTALPDNKMVSVMFPVHNPVLPVVNGSVYFIKNSSVFLHKSWESSAEELLIWFMGYHADFKASLLLGHRNDHVGPHSPYSPYSPHHNTTKIPSEVSWHSSQRSLTACIISSPLIGDSETSQ